MAMDEMTEAVIKKCNSVKAINSLSDKEKELLRKQADKNDRLQSNNDFLGKTENVKFFTFNLPSGITCPGKTSICANGCYQKSAEKMLQGVDRDSQVVYARKLNWFLAEQEDFVDRILDEILILNRRPKLNQRIIIRLHASGDFYSEEYLKKWMKIALITKLSGKDYDFVAYTKSFTELDHVLSNQADLNVLYKEAFGRAGKKELPEEKMLTLSDFNLHIIASFMDDTESSKKCIAQKWKLPVYSVMKDNDQKLKNCEEKPCAECLECYNFPMKTVVTGLRSS